MEKIKELITRLCSISGDKYLHFIVCMWIAQIICSIGRGLAYDALLPYAWGFAAAIVAGVIKEVIDKRVRKEFFDIEDIYADAAGAACGTLLMIIL